MCINGSIRRCGAWVWAVGVLLAAVLNAAELVTFTVSAPVHPVLIRKEHNFLEKVRIDVPTAGLRLTSLTFSMTGTDDFSDIELVEVLPSGGEGAFPPAVVFGRPERAAAVVTFSGDWLLQPGANDFWLSCRLRETAGLTRRVGATCVQVVTTAGEVAADPLVPSVRRRIGVALRKHYDDGVHTHRIPVLATTTQGTLLAAYDLRRGAARDLQGDIDIGLSRSTDGGQHWARPQVIMDMGEYGYQQQEENGCSDPGMIVDRETGEIFCFAVWMHGKPGQHQWTGTGSEPGFEIGTAAQFMMVRSKDDGVTWSPPENLTRKLKQEAWWLLAPSPQQGIQVAGGVLVMPVQGRDAQGVPFSTVMTSRDHGENWSVGAPARRQVSECQAVELSDGSILLNMRHDDERFRATAVTRDFGQTWELPAAGSERMIEPSCNASLLRIDLPGDKAAPAVLLFANPRSQTARTHQTLQVSFDDGRSWPVSHHLLLDELAGAGYPSLTRMDDGHVGIVYEGSQAQLVFEKFSLAELGIPAAVRSWAHPRELKTKKLIDAGIHTLDSTPIPLTSKSLADHPEFTRNHPFDGLAVRAALTMTPSTGEAPPAGSPAFEAQQECCLDGLAWSKWPLTDESVREAVADFKRVSWGSLTDNFLWWNCRGGSEVLKGDLASDADWEVIRGTVRLAARVCREAGLKGFLFDTEQYGYYAGTSRPYPFGVGDAELLRRRGRDWMEVVQSEFPEVRVMFTFAWSPDLPAAGFLAGVNDFIDGMLDGVVAPGRLIHGYENTFYYGQAAGSRFTQTGFAGGRPRYAEAREALRAWRSFSRHPAKFDAFVDVGMAAWMESDPWNLWAGFPSGTRDTVWSNVPLALAYSDEYAWCWSEHTNYFHSATADDPRLASLNPFLASLTNQTLNTGREAAVRLSEDFAMDPLTRGWYFDFDLLTAGRRLQPEQAVPVLAAETSFVTWSAADRAVRFQGAVPAAAPGERAALQLGTQRRRFVHPLRPLPLTQGFAATLDFRIDDFGGDLGNPLVLGIFHSEAPVDRRAFALHIAGPESFSWHVPRAGAAPVTTVTRPMERGRDYRARFNFEAATRQFVGTLEEVATGVVFGRTAVVMDVAGGDLGGDEIGLAQWDAGYALAAPETAYRCRLLAVEFEAR